jgi:hypothetical protein
VRLQDRCAVAMVVVRCRQRPTRASRAREVDLSGFASFLKNNSCDNVSVYSALNRRLFGSTNVVVCVFTRSLLGPPVERSYWPILGSAEIAPATSLLRVVAACLPLRLMLQAQARKAIWRRVPVMRGSGVVVVAGAYQNNRANLGIPLNRNRKWRREPVGPTLCNGMRASPLTIFTSHFLSFASAGYG